MDDMKSDTDANVEEILESVLDDIENFNFHGEDLDYSGDLRKTVMDSVQSYSNRHQQVVIRKLPEAYGDFLVSWLGASQWSNTDDIGGESNYTIKYDELCNYIEAQQ